MLGPYAPAFLYNSPRVRFDAVIRDRPTVVPIEPLCGKQNTKYFWVGFKRVDSGLLRQGSFVLCVGKNIGVEENFTWHKDPRASICGRGSCPGKHPSDETFREWPPADPR